MAYMPPLLPMLLSGGEVSSSTGASSVVGAWIVGDIDVLPTLTGEIDMAEFLGISEDTDVVLTTLKKDFTGTIINDATVTAEILDTDGTNVVSAVPMSYVSGTDGTYYGVFDAANMASLTDREWYYVEVSITSGTLDGLRRVKRQARYHVSEP